MSQKVDPIDDNRPRYWWQSKVILLIDFGSELLQNNAWVLKVWCVKFTNTKGECIRQLSIKIEVKVHYFVTIFKHKVNTQLII